MKLSIFLNELSDREIERMDKWITKTDFYDFYALNVIPDDFDEFTMSLKRTTVQKIKEDYIEYLTNEIYDELRTTKLGYVLGDNVSLKRYKKDLGYPVKTSDEEVKKYAEETAGFVSQEKMREFEIKTGILKEKLQKYQSAPERFTLEEMVKIYQHYPWIPYHGGKLWAKVTELLIELKNSNNIKNDIFVIDKIHDLHHNTGSIFSKRQLKWIDQALDLKAGKDSLERMIREDLLSPEVRKKLIEWKRIQPRNK